MQHIIQKLRAEAHNNLKFGQHPTDASFNYHAGVLISNQQAIDIANALEHLTAPPFILGVLNILESIKGNEQLQEYDWAAMDYNGLTTLYEIEPYISDDETYWNSDSGYLEIMRKMNAGFFRFEAKKMLFHRSAKGWEWVGGAEKQQ